MNKPSYLLALLLGACSYPVASVKTVEAHPMLQVFGAPSAAVLLVDQQQAGLASAYGGGRVLIVPHGTHHVEIRSGSAVLYSSDVYFGDDTLKTVTIAQGVQ